MWVGCWGVSMSSAQVSGPALGPGLRFGGGLSVFVEVVFCPVGADAIEVVRGQGEAQQDGDLGDTHDPYEPAGQVGEGAFESGIDRLDDLAASYGDPPGDTPDPLVTEQWTVIHQFTRGKRSTRILQDI